MIGNRLKRAREAAGLSLRELEAAIDAQVSAQAIGKYERDEMMPGSTVLLAMAKAPGVSPEFLLSESEIELAGVDFRKATQASVTEEKAVEAAVLDQVERYLQLEELMPGDSWQPPAGREFTIGPDRGRRACGRFPQAPVGARNRPDTDHGGTHGRQRNKGHRAGPA